MSISNVLIKIVAVNKQDMRKRDFKNVRDSTISIEGRQRSPSMQIRAVSDGKCYTKDE